MLRIINNLLWRLLALTVLSACIVLGGAGAIRLWVLCIETLVRSGWFAKNTEAILSRTGGVIAIISGASFIGFLGAYWVKRWPHFRPQELTGKGDLTVATTEDSHGEI